MSNEARSLTRWGKGHEYQSLESFLAINNDSNPMVDKKFTLSIFIDGIPVDFLISLRGPDCVFFFHGNHPREGTTLPVFVGQGVMENIDASYVAISDPTLFLDEGMSLGWYTAVGKIDFQKILPVIIKKLIKLFDFRNITFAGGSAGGFAALYFSQAFDNIDLLVWNPQTDIMKYNQKAVDTLKTVTAKSFVTNEIDINIANYYDISILDSFNVSKGNRIFFLQNFSDWHYPVHCVPFFEALGVAISRDNLPKVSGWYHPSIYLHVGLDWGDGHAPPHKALISDFLDSILRKDHLFLCLGH